MATFSELLKKTAQQAQAAAPEYLKRQELAEKAKQTLLDRANGTTTTPTPAPVTPTTPEPTPTTPTTPQIPEAAQPATPQQSTQTTQEVKPFVPTATAPAYETIDYAARLEQLGGGTYQPSETVQAAQNYLNNIIANKPGSYESKYTGQLEALYNQIMNRDPFSYDLNGDALYQQYRDMYTMQGQAAMQDTMGQAAALTGGYGNSYANTAGMQAYQSYLQQLNDVVPELQQQAYDRYLQEGQDLQNRFAITQAADEAAYGRWLDSYDSWLNDRAYAQGAYDSAYSRDYNDYANRLNAAQNILGMEQADLAQKNSNAFNEYLTQLGYNRSDYENERDTAREDQLIAGERDYNDKLIADERAYEDALRQQEYEREDALIAGEREYNDKLIEQGYENEYAQNTAQQAYTYAMAMISEGAMPSDALLAAAGISKADATALAKKFGYKASSSSSKSSSSGTSAGSTSTESAAETVSTYDDWLKKLLGK